MGQCPTWWPPCQIQAAPSVQRHKVWLTLTTRVPCSNAAKMQKSLKLAGVSQTRQQISAVSGSISLTLWQHVEQVLLFNKFFFPIVDTCLTCEGTAWQSRRWCRDGDFLPPVFSASRVQYISDQHAKFALRPHHVWKYGRHPVCNRWD